MVRYSGNLFFKIFYNQLFEWSCFVRFDANTTIIPPSCCQDPVCWVLQPSIRSQPNWIGRGLSWFPPLYVDFCSSMSATYGITTADSHWCGVTVVIPQVHSLNAFAFTVYFISLLDQRRYVRCFNFFTEPMDSGHSHPTISGVVTFGIAVAQLASHPHRWLAAPIDCPMQGSFSTVSPLSV